MTSACPSSCPTWNAPVSCHAPVTRRPSNSSGRARFLFFSREIHLVVQVTEEPSSAIDINLVTGDMKVYRCRWEITPMPETGGTRISYSGKMVPKFYVPGMLGSNIVRGDIERMMGAVLERLDRPEE
ncbi:hypothetical protein LP420_19465 [Massilia sp. B-10]|nr:hypothetical protein LP420_19465 [Massilia sp. B-10]